MSAAEKFGAELLDELAEPPADEVDGVDEDEDEGVLDESVELLLPEALPETEGVDEDEDGELEDDEDDCATASVDSAKSTAAVVTLRVLVMSGISNG